MHCSVFSLKPPFKSSEERFQLITVWSKCPRLQLYIIDFLFFYFFLIDVKHIALGWMSSSPDSYSKKKQIIQRKRRRLRCLRYHSLAALWNKGSFFLTLITGDSRINCCIRFLNRLFLVNFISVCLDGELSKLW